MFNQSMSRSQRARGSKAKKFFQVTVLLAVVVWLLYQAKHSYDRRTEYDETNYNRLSNGDTDIIFSRKVNAGSENRISIDPHGKNSEETTEMGETGVDQDAFDQNSEKTAEEVKDELEESREDITNSGKEETQQEQQHNVDDNGDPHIAGDVNTDGMQEGLRLPSQMDGDNFDQNESQNGLPKYGAISAGGTDSSDGETIVSNETTLSSSATNQTENGENPGQGSETGKTGGEHRDNAVPVTEELSSSSTTNDQRNKDISDDKDSHKGRAVDSQEGTGPDTKITSNNTVEAATTNPSSDDVVVTQNVNLPNSTEQNNVVVPVNDGALKEEIESQVTSDATAEIARTTGASYDSGNANFTKSVEENNVVMPDSNGAPGGEEGETQDDRISEGQATGNSFIEAVTADTNSEGENANLSSSSEGKGLVMSDNNGAPKDEEVRSQMDHVSEGEKTEISDEQSNAGKNSKAPEKGAAVSQGANASDDEVTTNHTVAEENDRKFSDEADDSSLTKNVHVELPANKEDAVGEEVKSQGNSASDAENPGKSSLEEDKSGKSDDVANSAQNNEKNTSKNVKDATTEPSNDATTSGLGNNIELSSGKKIREGQEGSTGSKSANSGSEV